MPLITVSLIKGKSPAHIRAISSGIQHGLVEVYGVPEADKFQMVRHLDRDELIYDANYLGIHRSDDLVIIHIVASNWRETPKKKALYTAITAKLVEDPGLRPEDVLIVLSPNAKEDWCFGNGIASYASDDPA